MKLIPIHDIEIAKERQRKEFKESSIVDLANSIMSIGLIHPVVVKGELGIITLVAGERRLRAIETIYGLGQTFTHGGREVTEPCVPCTYIKDLDPLDAMEIELEENIRRVDLTWQERSAATSQLFELRRLQAEKAGRESPAVSEFAKEVYPKDHPTWAHTQVREELILSRNLSDPDVAKAPTQKEALKIIKRKEESARSAALGASVGRIFSAADHTLLRGDCISHLQSFAESGTQFDCILSDPPYGMNAQEFGDSQGKGTAHSYDDTLVNWSALMDSFCTLSFLCAKAQAHCYLFCDIDQFFDLRGRMLAAGWTVFRTPFVWHNPSSQRAPWPHTGPHRRYQLLLYAVKGSRPTLKLAPDVLTYGSDINLNWAAQKPVALYSDLLSRTCRPGDTVCDPFTGTGTIFPAAHGLKVKATGIELDATAYGIAAERLEKLK